MGVAMVLGQTVVLQAQVRTPRTGCACCRPTAARRRSPAATPIRMICVLPEEVKAKYDRFVG